MDEVSSPVIPERPIFLTERDLTRAEISAMGDERERSAQILEANLCKMIEKSRKEIECQRRLLADVRREADELESLRRVMKQDELAWCSIQAGRRVYRKLTSGDLPKEAVRK